MGEKLKVDLLQAILAQLITNGTVSLVTGDVEIGAVEIKNDSTDTRAKVGPGADTNALRTVAATNDPGVVSLASILAKLIAAPATEAKQDTGNTILTALGALLTTQAGYLDGIEGALAPLATQTTLAAVLTALSGSGLISTVGTRVLAPVKSTLAYGQTSYSSGKNIGGRLAISTGLPVGTILSAGVFRVKSNSTLMTATGNIAVTFFDTDPVNSTTADNSTGTVNALDVPNMTAVTLMTSSPGANGAIVYSANTNRMAVDAAGKIYATLVGSGTVTFAAAGNLDWHFEGTY